MVSIFRWWRGTPLGTALVTRRRGRKVGQDDQGNTYYESKDGKRRWVLYNGENEASRVPPEWHLWLHHTAKQPPSEASPRRQAWEKDHVPNLTGTSGAYFPPGSLSVGGERGKTSGDYEAWTPE